MGSADHQFNLAEILSQNYSLREGCAEASRCPDKPEEELDKDFISQSSDMPLDELLALYGYEASDPISEQESESGNATPNLPDMTLDKEQIAKDLLSGEEEEETQSSADDLTPSVTCHEASSLFPNQSGSRFLGNEDKDPSSSASSDTEEDSLPANKCKKEIMVGPQFQADLSSLHLNRHSEKIYENEDQLLWVPNILPEREVEEFLYRAVKRRWHEMAGSQLPEGETVKDSEQALYELVKCNFNVEEALRRLRFNVKVIRDGLCAWSEEERRNFEHGFRVHGKNFHLIQANKVRTRSVGECVEYYYCGRNLSAMTTLPSRQGWAGGSLSRLEPRACMLSSAVMLVVAGVGVVGHLGGPFRVKAPVLLAFCPSQLFLHRDTDQDLDGLDPDGTTRTRPDQEPLAGVHTEPLSVDNMASGLGQPGVGSDGLPSLESGLCPFQQLDEPPTVPLPQQPPALTDPAEYTSAPATSQPNASPRLAVDFALPEELPLMSSHVDLSGDPEEPVAPAQVALSVTEFGLIGIGDVNPFLAGHPVCPAPPLHSEPLSHCNVMTC
uniref:Mesoderm induction early response protein 2 n=1 Tax=Castor canadensis TaxID=51338 RepID=A0A8C0X5D8_CASCN